MKKTGLCCLAALLLSGCQVESTDNTQTNTGNTANNGNAVNPPASCSLLDQHQQFARLFEIPIGSQDNNVDTGIYYELGAASNADAVSPTQSLSDLMAQVRSPTDRWSFVSEISQSNDPYAALHQSLGMRWEPIEAPESTVETPLYLPELRVLYVYPGSPADTAGIRRGMTISQINGLSVPAFTPNDNEPVEPALELYQQRITSMLEGQNVQLTTIGGTVVAQRPVSRLSYSSLNVPTDALNGYTLADGRRAGYFYLDSFYTSEAHYVWMFNRFRQLGVTELIIDLRNNGGGLVTEPHMLAQLILGNSRDGLVFNTLEFNAYHTSKNIRQTFNLGSFSTDIQNVALQFNQVIFLTSSRTASSAEVLINGLSPYINTVVIGSRTAGKPYGQRPVQICNNVVYPISFINLNANNQPIPTDGISTFRGCEVPDVPDVTRPLGYAGDLNNGNDGEVMLERALNYLNRGGCFAL